MRSSTGSSLELTSEICATTYADTAIENETTLTDSYLRREDFMAHLHGRRYDSVPLVLRSFRNRHGLVARPYASNGTKMRFTSAPLYLLGEW